MAVGGCYDGLGAREPDVVAPGDRNLQTQVGRLTSVGNGEYRQWFDYDAAGHIVQTWWRFDGRTYAASSTYGYATRAARDGEIGDLVVEEHLAHRPNAIGERIAYGYDRAGAQRRMTALRPDGSAQAIVVDRRSDALGRTTRIVLGTCSAGTCDGSDVGRLAVDSTYDPATLRLASMSAAQDAELLLAAGYHYDPNGNLEAFDDFRDERGDACSGSGGGCRRSALSADYEYDSLDRLAHATSGGFELASGYDPRGNLVHHDRVVGGARRQVTQTYGGDGRGPHAIASSDGTTFGYDERGNLVGTAGRKDGDLEIAWNAENMAIVVHGDDGQLYRKHYLGNSLWKRVEGDETTYFLPSTRITTDGEGNDSVRTYYAELAERDDDGDLHFTVTDRLGSAELVVAASGELEHRGAWWSWGDARGDLEGSFTPTYGWQGKEHEPLTGLVDFAARLYLPETGRFVSADPFTIDGPNRYAFVRNNPLRYVDPTGFTAEDKNRIQGPPGLVVNRGDTIVTDDDLGTVQIVAKDPCPSCGPVAHFGHDIAGPSNDIFGAIGDTNEGWYKYVRDDQIRSRTKYTRAGKLVRVGKPSAYTLRGIGRGGRFGLVGDVFQGVDSGISAVENVSEGKFGAAGFDLLEGGLNIWGGRVGAAIGLKCGPGAVVCAPVLGYLGGKTGTASRSLIEGAVEGEAKMIELRSRAGFKNPYMSNAERLGFGR